MSGMTYNSVPDMLRSNAERFSSRPALKYRKLDSFVTLTYAAYYERVLMVSRGLANMSHR